MTEAQAWREVARRHVELERKYSHGICAEMWGLHDEKRIDLSVAYTAVKRCMSHADISPDRYAPYAFPLHGHDEERILAALWLALEAEEEAKC